MEDLLTEREHEVMDLVRQGHTNTAIGHLLEISEHTVAAHMRSIFAKLDVNTRAAAVARYDEIHPPNEIHPRVD